MLRGGLAAALLALVLTGCSSSGDDASPSPSPAPSAAASSSPAAPATEKPPVLPAAARAKGPAGQRAFAAHVMDLWGYALRTNDPKPLTTLRGSKPCGGCDAFARTLASRRTQGWAVDFSGLEVRSVKLTGKAPETVATARVDVPESDSYNDDGSFRNTSPAHAGATFVVRMRYTGKAYRLVSFTVS